MGVSVLGGGAQAAAPGTRPVRDDRAKIVRRLDEIRRLARALRGAATTPSVERVAQLLETECHLALWALGEPRGMTP